MAEYSGSRSSNSHLLEELENLSRSLNQPNTSNRRTNSLVLPRNAVPPILVDEEVIAKKNEEKIINPKPRQRRMSLSPWRSRPKLDDGGDEKEPTKGSTQKEGSKFLDKPTSSEKKGLWNWKPIRALTHIGMQKISCLFSVEVVTAQNLPASMNGLRLSVCVRKKETKEGAVQTMPSRVSHGAADFEETLFIRCHVYCTTGTSTHQKFESRPFYIYLFAVDADELDFGRNSVDLSNLIRESVAKNSEGTRVRQWDTSFNLSGKAKGGELVLKLGFQIMDKDGSGGIYSQTDGQKANKEKNFSPSIGRKQSKKSFSIQSPRMNTRAEAWTPSQAGLGELNLDYHGIEELNLDEPATIPSVSPSVQRSEEPDFEMDDKGVEVLEKTDDLDLPDFEIVDKGVEVMEKTGTDEAQSEDNSDKRSVSSEVVKEVVHDPVHLSSRLTELDSIAQQIKALENMMDDAKSVRTDDDVGSQKLDADEETVTMEFLQMLENEDANKYTPDKVDSPSLLLDGEEEMRENESRVLIPDLGKGLGCVVQTRNGGYLAATNPLNALMGNKDTPKLAMQLSKPLVISSDSSTNGFDFLQRMAAIGVEAFCSEASSVMPLDELMGKTAEQIAFEGIASAIIHGRNKEGASSTAARTITAVKTMATAMHTGRKERISTGIWNVIEEPLTAEEILAYSMQKIEAMAVEALKIQAEMSEEDPPFDVSPMNEKDKNHPLASAVSIDEWMKNESYTNTDSIMISVLVQLRDPLRRYEGVGGPLIALINATSDEQNKSDNYDEEKNFKLVSLHVGGLRVGNKGKRNVWDSEKQKLTAIQWLVAYGLGKAGKKGKHGSSKANDVLWSLSSRVMADMWLKQMRNPDVKFTK